YIPAMTSFLLLITGLTLDHVLIPDLFSGYLRLAWYLAAYLPVGWPVIKDAYVALRKGDFFTEFTLMTVATIGAFAIGEFPEGVAVMLFYTVGELFQGAPVKRAKRSIQTL